MAARLQDIRRQNKILNLKPESEIQKEILALSTDATKLNDPHFFVLKSLRTESEKKNKEMDIQIIIIKKKRNENENYNEDGKRPCAKPPKEIKWKSCAKQQQLKSIPNAEPAVQPAICTYILRRGCSALVARRVLF